MVSIDFKAIYKFIIDWIRVLMCFVKTRFMTDFEKDLEIQALRSQLALFKQNVINNKIPKPVATPVFRQIWIILSKVFPKWKESLMLVKPETVLKWHKTAFGFYWMIKSRKLGRPKLSDATINLIKKIHLENPLLSPKKIHERLVELNIEDAPAPNTIAKYITKTGKSPSEKQRQSWRTFLKNHSREIWAMDFFVVPTIKFKVLYVLIILSHDRRRIEHFNVTANPSSAWVVQQMRDATPFGEMPKYLIHDNDTIFRAGSVQDFLTNCYVSSKRTSFFSPWQNGICERCIGILRAELLNHVIPINEEHLRRLLKEYIHRYYHPIRTHQGLECRPPILKDKPDGSKVADTVLVADPILGGLYHGYRKVA